MIQINVKGRKELINELKDVLKASGHCARFEVECPEAFNFCGSKDLTSMQLTSISNFIDFNLFLQKRFRTLNLKVQVNRTILIKDFNTMYFQNISTQATSLKCRKNCMDFEYLSVIDNENDDNDSIILNPYETMELFEERLQGVRE